MVAVSGIFRKLREHEYTPDLVKLYVMGGGSCMVKRFGKYDPARMSFNHNVCATAEGYELLATERLRLDMTNEEDRRAWSHPQQMDKKRR